MSKITKFKSQNLAHSRLFRFYIIYSHTHTHTLSLSLSLSFSLSLSLTHTHTHVHTHTHTHTYIYIYIYTGNLYQNYCPVGWGCRIHRLLLCRGVRPPPTSVLDMTLKNLMVRFQPCWSFRECGVPLYCHCSQVHSGPEW